MESRFFMIFLNFHEKQIKMFLIFNIVGSQIIRGQFLDSTGKIQPVKKNIQFPASICMVEKSRVMQIQQYNIQSYIHKE